MKKDWRRRADERTECSVGFKLTKSERAWLEAVAKRRRTSISELCRGAAIYGTPVDDGRTFADQQCVDTREAGE